MMFNIFFFRTKREFHKHSEKSKFIEWFVFIIDIVQTKQNFNDQNEKKRDENNEIVSAVVHH